MRNTRTGFLYFKMASFTDKPKIPLLGNRGSETFASLGTKKGSFESAYGTKFALRKVSVALSDPP